MKILFMNWIIFSHYYEFPCEQHHDNTLIHYQIGISKWDVYIWHKIQITLEWANNLVLRRKHVKITTKLHTSQNTSETKRECDGQFECWKMYL